MIQHAKIMPQQKFGCKVEKIALNAFIYSFLYLLIKA
jgi:hypothetical protein